jgi:exopolysaccharide production protein ExoQ
MRRFEETLVTSSESDGSAAIEARASSLEWLVAVFCLIVQHNGAFTAVHMMLSGDSLRITVNPLNTIAVSISAPLIVLVLLPQIRGVASLARRNLPSMLFLALVLLSTTWSIHPDITIRRGTGYLLTIALATYLVVRFDAIDRMRVLSASFAVSAVGSLIFVALFPNLGIMHVADLAGAWRGVFPHKNVLGPVMALAMFVELYVIVAATERSKWRFALLALYAALVVLSHSATALLLATGYSAGAGLYLLWKRHRRAAALVVINGSIILVMGLIVVSSDPTLALSAIGKDPTLTGRTTLWEVVVAFIREKPVFGWGYRAMWVLDDPTTQLADRLTGGWGVTSSHNAFLEILLELGVAGMSVMLAILGSGLWRGLRCCRAGIAPLGWFSLVYFGGAILAAQTIETLGRAQAIDWVVFSVLLFGCDRELAAVRRARTLNAVRNRPSNRQGWEDVGVVAG